MKMLIAASFMVGTLATPIAAADRIWTVDEVAQHAWQLNGQIINVRGWLQECRKIDCSLFGSKADALGFSSAPLKHPLLEIGSSSDFDSMVANKLPAEILLRAKVDATCIDPKDRTDAKGNRLITFCVDRVNELQPVRLIKIQPAADKAVRVRK
jgi:hypothetical protein